jgi:uncharacterized RDD family membrane protein YckC
MTRMTLQDRRRLRPARREARLVAFAIDALLLLALGPLFLAVGGLTVLVQTNWLEVDPTHGEWIAAYAVVLLWLVVPLLYFALAPLRGGTVGARRLSLTLSRTTGEPLTLAATFQRAALMYPSLGLLALGALPSLRDRSGRTLHDRFSHTLLLEPAAPFQPPGVLS